MLLSNLKAGQKVRGTKNYAEIQEGTTYDILKVNGSYDAGPFGTITIYLLQPVTTYSYIGIGQPFWSALQDGFVKVVPLARRRRDPKPSRTDALATSITPPQDGEV